MTEQIAERIAQWYQDNIKPAELDKKVEDTLTYLKRFNEPDGGEWELWAYEFVDGHHGVHKYAIFLNDVLGVDEYQEPLDECIEVLEEVSGILAQLFNDHTKLPGRFWIGENENDGSLGVTYNVRV